MDREEALKQIRNWSLPKETREVLETLIPELRESEDERIRKYFVWIVKNVLDNIQVLKLSDEQTRELIENYDGIKVSDMLAWLEKQKEQKPVDKCKDCNNVKGCVTCVDGSEWAHIEEPEEWSEEDGKLLDKIEVMLDSYCDYLEDASSNYIPEVRETISRLKSLRPQPHWKPSEEQMDALCYALQVMNTDLSPIAAKTYQGLQEIQQNLRKLM